MRSIEVMSQLSVHTHSTMIDLKMQRKLRKCAALIAVITAIADLILIITNKNYKPPVLRLLDREDK